MDIKLSLYETRVIGSLIEKAITTPDQYPLSLNALTNACNQKSNRDPVLELDERTVQATVDELIKKRLVVEKGGFGSRVRKFQHRFCNTEFGALRLSDQELAIVCELLLRGPQTPGELRGRASRLCNFRDVQEVESTLQHLMQRGDGPFVARLAREPGKRESRYAHLFSGEVLGLDAVQAGVAEAQALATPLSSADGDRLDRLERRVSELSEEVQQLKARLEQLLRRPGPGAGSTGADA